MRTCIAIALVGLSPLCGAVAGGETWRMVRTTEPPVLDGRLDDPCWASSLARAGFIQRDPRPGEPSTEETTLYAVYTDRALYIAFFCGDSQPDRIVSRLRSRDSSVWPDDNIDLWIDPTGNGLQLYYFSTNPSGVKYDALYTSRGQDSNPLWNAHWDVAAAVGEDGWNAEFEIPFSNLKFDSDSKKPWLFNAGRLIRRTGEESYTTAVPYEHNMFYVEDAVRLVGLEGIDPGVGVKVTPYAKGDHRWFPPLPTEDNTDFQGNAGIDIDVDIGSNLTLAAAVYPDFAEIDLNPDQYQIGFDQIFVPETRPFFLRDSNYFNTINFQPFYSRRIGTRLFDENGVYHDADIVVGARLTGKVGKVGMGAFYTHTDEALSEPASDWVIGRTAYELGPRSFVGLVGTMRSAAAVSYDGTAYSAYDFGSFGLDYEYYFKDNWNTWGMLIGTHDTRFPRNELSAQYGHSGGMAWRRGGFEAWGNYVDSAERFSTDETGFVPRTDVRTVEGGVSQQWGFGDALFRNLRAHLHGIQHRDRDWDRAFDQYELELSTLTRFSWRLNLNLIAGVDQRFYREGEKHDFYGLATEFNTNPAAVVSLFGETIYGSLADYTTSSWGRLSHNSLGVSISPLTQLQLGGHLQYNRWWMDKGQPSSDYDVAIWQTTAEYLFTRELFFRLFGQGSTQNDQNVFRALLGWEYTPDSNLYLAYEQWRDDSDGAFELVNHGIFLKLDHFVQF